MPLLSRQQGQLVVAAASTICKLLKQLEPLSLQLLGMRVFVHKLDNNTCMRGAKNGFPAKVERMKKEKFKWVDAVEAR